jgi:hypothetical protein
LIIPPLTCVTSNNHSPLFLALGERERERERGGGGVAMAQLSLHYAKIIIQQSTTSTIDLWPGDAGTKQEFILGWTIISSKSRRYEIFLLN